VLLQVSTVVGVGIVQLITIYFTFFGSTSDNSCNFSIVRSHCSVWSAQLIWRAVPQKNMGLVRPAAMGVWGLCPCWITGPNSPQLGLGGKAPWR